MKKIRIVFLLFLAFISCNSPTNRDILTYKVQKKDFTIHVESEGTLEAIKSHNLAVPQLRRIVEISFLAKEGTKLKAGDVAFKMEANELKNNYMNALDQLAVTRADAEKRYAELELERLEYELQYRNAMAAKKTAQLQSTKLEFEPLNVQEIKKLEIEQYEVEARRNMEKMESLVAIQAEEKAHQDLKIKLAQANVDRIKSDLSKLVVTTPVNGFVVYERSRWTGEYVAVGDQAFPGMPVVKIPDMSAMQVKLYVSENEAQKLKPGQIASIYIPVLKELDLTGKVSFVDKMARPIRRRSKVKKVEVVVKIDSTYTGMVPGLSALCNIEIETIKDVLAVPLECVFEQDSVKIVFSKEGDSFVPRPVAQTGQDYDYTLLQGHLSDSLDLALLKPADSMINWPDTLIAYQVPVDSTILTDSTKTAMKPDSLAVLNFDQKR